ncbi:MAG TPA: D-2-hydroxyacid dehydrogenase [Pirellulales bacterium]|jgi:phosphoglycerate dehydrogenase-like enzyme|nr:D-2-hydroxyacid dehydrogenase [Pirellulales bacterium]
MKLLLYPAVDERRLEAITRAAGTMSVVNAADEDAARAAIGDADAMFGKITAPLLAAARRLRWVQSPTVSLEHYVFPELVEHSAVLTNMRGIFSDVIAEQVFGYILCFSRNLHHYIRRQATRRWEPLGGEGGRVENTFGPAFVSPIDRAHRQLTGATLGVIGLGGIGMEVARRARAFGMRVVAVDPRPLKHIEGVEACWPPAEAQHLLEQSDYVVIAAPHTPETAGSFGAKQFEQMKPGAVLVNVGRGAIVDLAALAAALQNGRLGGAALDVFETEPLPSEHPLWQMENVILTPHVAGYGPQIAARHLDVVVTNIRRFVRDEPLVNVVNKAAWF